MVSNFNYSVLLMIIIIKNNKQLIFNLILKIIMVIVSSYAWAVVLCIITMLCWGSWANTQKLATKKWPFQLFYWDYSLGVVILSLSFALTLGSIGDNGRSFFSDISQATFNVIILALLGGIVFNLANITFSCSH
jgi:glucose uptake protein